MRVTSLSLGSKMRRSSRAAAMLATVLVCVIGEGVAAAETVPDPAAAALEQLRAANQARAELAREEAAWTGERQRLQAILAATRAETARREHDAVEAERLRDGARERLAALGSASDLDEVRARLAAGGERLRLALAAIATQVPPGVVPAIADSADDAVFDAAVRALEAAERAASTVAVEVITGTRGGAPEAAKVLRVSGAAAWWVSLDGTAAGTVRVRDGAVELVDEADPTARDAIMAALAQAEGRGQATVVLLPSLSGEAP